MSAASRSPVTRSSRMERIRRQRGRPRPSRRAEWRVERGTGQVSWPAAALALGRRHQRSALDLGARQGPGPWARSRRRRGAEAGSGRSAPSRGSGAPTPAGRSAPRRAPRRRQLGDRALGADRRHQHRRRRQRRARPSWDPVVGGEARPCLGSGRDQAAEHNALTPCGKRLPTTSRARKMLKLSQQRRQAPGPCPSTAASRPVAADGRRRRPAARAAVRRSAIPTVQSERNAL